MQQQQNTAVWTAFVNGLQGTYVQPIDLSNVTAQRYDMGRPVGSFVEEAASEPVAVAAKPAKQAKQAKPAAGRAGTKAEVVRGMIATAKSANQTQADVVVLVVAEFGMTKQLAKAYVKNNWDRV